MVIVQTSPLQEKAHNFISNQSKKKSFLKFPIYYQISIIIYKMLGIILIILPLNLIALQGCAQESSQGTCNICQERYYLTQEKLCRMCAKNCLYCKSKSECLRCQNSSTLYSNRCFLCQIQGCLLCKVNQKCLLCDEGYYKNLQICQKCSENCIQCNKERCQVCISGYTLNNLGECIQIETFTQTQPSIQINSEDHSKQKDTSQFSLFFKIILILLGTLTGLVCFLTLIFIVTKFKKRRMLKKNSFQPPLPEATFPTQNQQQIIVQQSSFFFNLFTTCPNQNINSCKLSSTKQYREVCAICLCGNTDIQTSCSHMFHAQCLVVWCHKKYSCPNCNNRSFWTRVKCLKCRQFSQEIVLCRKPCKRVDHFLCFKQKIKQGIICQGCL